MNQAKKRMQEAVAFYEKEATRKNEYAILLILEEAAAELAWDDDARAAIRLGIAALVAHHENTQDLKAFDVASSEEFVPWDELEAGLDEPENSEAEFAEDREGEEE